MKTFNQSRRRLIQSVAGGAAATRLMTLMPHAVFAQGTAPKRLLCVFHPMGYLENSFWPTGEGAAFTLGETQHPLNSHKSNLLYIDGLLNSARAYWDSRWVEKDNEHGSGINGIFTGSQFGSGTYSATASIDQVVASALYAQTPTPHKSISLGVNTGGGSHGSAFFVSGDNPVRPMTSVTQAYDTLFANLKAQSGAAPDNTAFLRAKMLKQRVIDSSRAELKAVCDRIGAAEKAMCDAHLEGINQLESRLKALQPLAAAGCSKPAASAGGGDPQATIRANMDLIKSAFACDLSRVATLQIGGADGAVDVAGFAGQHETTHDVNVVEHKKWDSWWATQWAYLLQQLGSVNEVNGTLLDNTLIVFGSDTTTSQSGAHSFRRFPIWLAGGSNFAFKTGRTIKVAMPVGSANSQWRYHNTLLVSVARAFGLNINTFGTWDQGKGPMAELA